MSVLRLQAVLCPCGCGSLVGLQAVPEDEAAARDLHQRAQEMTRLREHLRAGTLLNSQVRATA